MPATREQLEDRWETPEGQQMAREVCHLLARGVPGPSEPRAVTIAELHQLTASLPFREEVAPSLDLRGLHIEQDNISLSQEIDLSGARLDYAFEIDAIIATRMVGTSFDGCHATNSHFSADFSSASFVAAKLQGVRFLDSTLVQANFRQAKLALAKFREIDCRHASFVETDLRFADLAQADLRGADFSGANLTEANMDEVKFDERTRLRGANLRGAILSEELQLFAEQSGATLGSSQKEEKQAELSLLIRLLREDNEHGQLNAAIAYLEDQAKHMARNPEHSWSMEMHKSLPPEMTQEIIAHASRLRKILPYYL